VRTVASTDATVLITGESGTGKELVARAIHELSGRRTNGFVTLNCAAIPAGLLERELFGHERGAFTGAAASQIGRFELANRGSLFLDEIADMPLELQPKLLRVLQEREFERLGGIRTIRTDARIIAATNRDLEAEAEDGEFRADLFYRLNIFPIHIPPLSERPDDIPLLVEHFVRLFSKRLHRVIESIPAATMDALTRRPWPGNIRELRNVLERAVILSPGPVLQIRARDLQTPNRRIGGADRSAKAADHTLEAVERAHILSTLHGTGWVVGGLHGAAAVLGINRATLQFRMKRLGISRPRFAQTVAADS
jgi:formate hydrogenlyase transcriptional activator